MGASAAAAGVPGDCISLFALPVACVISTCTCYPYPAIYGRCSYQDRRFHSDPQAVPNDARCSDLSVATAASPLKPAAREQRHDTGATGQDRLGEAGQTT
ncbi:uncharacterized protein LOC119525183 isoform X2 [Choloepus didactylus]|uniref:uncharacterized protein LOC119525183 isoform X2 n=1 Tax=Choloepus didactylus TaxID=27675 RepID=UPI00189C8FA1|nr:uncharacterized protein LOC119525183 isoform X2 [Choloepus didactylus]